MSEDFDAEIRHLGGPFVFVDGEMHMRFGQVLIGPYMTSAILAGCAFIMWMMLGLITNAPYW